MHPKYKIGMQPINTQIEKQEIDEDIETLTITYGEYAALDQIYGLSSEVHSMVMLARPDQDKNYVLTGTQSTFEALQSDLAEEIYSELSSKSNLKKLRRLYRRLVPDEDL
jgi:hypothetical protein